MTSHKFDCKSEEEKKKARERERREKRRKHIRNMLLTWEW